MPILFKTWLQNYFGFNQREINGFILLVFLMAIAFIASLFANNDSNYSAKQQLADEALLSQTMASINLEELKVKEAKRKKYKSYSRKEYTNNYKSKYSGSKKSFKKEKQIFFPFNPNTASKDDLMVIGLFESKADQIINYRNKGGEFRVKSDLMKIYGFPEKLYAQLEPYIELPDSLPKNDFSSFSKPDSAKSGVKYSKKKFVITPFDLGTADTSQLKQIRGIGSWLSTKIVEYREELGGFYSISQLSEVWGLKPEVIVELEKYATLSNPEIRQININKASLEALQAHPYIYYKQANVIVNYRIQHGKYQSANDLLKIKLLDQKWINKIEPYINFD